MRLNRAQLLGAQLPIEEFVEALEGRRAGLATAILQRLRSRRGLREQKNSCLWLTSGFLSHGRYKALGESSPNLMGG